MSEPLIALLSELPAARLDPARAARIRTRCRARLARLAPDAPASSAKTVHLWQPAITVLGVAYLIAAFVQAFSVSSKF